MPPWLAPRYDFSLNDFQNGKGHFSQIVWKDTSSIGCAMQSCPTGLGANFNYANSFIVVCRYWPPGNVDGEVWGRRLQGCRLRCAPSSSAYAGKVTAHRT